VESGTLLADRYRLTDRIGTGGTATVWRAFDTVLDRLVAVKILTLADSTQRANLQQEARAAARLNHPHITNVFDYGESTLEDGTVVPFIVMELLEGESLASRLTRGGPLPLNEGLRVCAEVAEALAAAHRRGLIHRDVTANNVFLTPDGVKVLDFGIAAIPATGGPGRPQAVLGTPAYIAPERIEHGASLPATDVYALGVLLYHTLTGRYPFGGTWPQLVKAHLRSPAPPLPGVPPAVAAIYRQCLAKSPQERPTAAEVAAVLRAAAPSSSAMPVPTSPQLPSTELLPVPVRGPGSDTRLLPEGYPADRRRLSPLPLMLLASLVTGAVLAVLLVAMLRPNSGQGANEGLPTDSATQGEISLLPAPLVAQVRTLNTDPNDNQIQFAFRLINLGDVVVDLTAITVRYWFTGDFSFDQSVDFQSWCDWAEVGNDTITHRVVSLPDQRPGADHYLEVGFTSGDIPAGGSSGEVQLRLNKEDWSLFDESDDHSHVASADFTESDTITVYAGTDLIWGTEP